MKKMKEKREPISYCIITWVQSRPMNIIEIIRFYFYYFLVESKPATELHKRSLSRCIVICGCWCFLVREQHNRNYSSNWKCPVCVCFYRIRRMFSVLFKWLAHAHGRRLDRLLDEIHQYLFRIFRLYSVYAALYLYFSSLYLYVLYSKDAMLLLESRVEHKQTRNIWYYSYISFVWSLLLRKRNVLGKLCCA